MNTLYLVLQIVASAYAVYVVLYALYINKENLSFIWIIWKRFRFWMFLQTLLLLFVVFLTYVSLNRYIPFLHYGWLNLIFKNGGNIIAAPVTSTFQSEYVWIRVLAPLFLSCLLLALPFLAEGEEKAFRKGCYEWKKMFGHSICFGLVHLIAGIPISAGIALIIPGLFFARKYQCAYKELLPVIGKKEAAREAVLVSTTYHTLMNSTLISWLLFLTIRCI